METAERKIRKGDYIPYGTLGHASYELRQAYYAYGFKNDESLPELPCDPYYEGLPVVDPEEVVAQHELHRVVAEVLDSLAPREAKILRMRYGIDLPADMTLEEIGIRFDVTRERIRQIEAKALRKLKHPSRRDVLAQFVYPDDIETTADKQRKKEEIIRRVVQQKMETEARFSIRHSLKLKIQSPPAGVSWVEHLAEHAPDVYKALRQHVERYIHEYA